MFEKARNIPGGRVAIGNIDLLGGFVLSRELSAGTAATTTTETRLPVPGGVPSLPADQVQDLPGGR